MDYIIYPEIFKNKGVMAFFTGKSPGADIEKISAITGVSKEKIYMPIQRHTAEVVELPEDMSSVVADSVITNRRGVLVGVKVADCVPILLYSKTHISAIHAGWRGTAKGILLKTIKKILTHSKPEDILIAIGPSIRWCCYKVGEDVLDAVVLATGKGDYYIEKEGSLCLDLPTANLYQATSLGILRKNIWLSEECTYCNPQRFHSYRFAKDHSGRQAGFIGII